MTYETRFAFLGHYDVEGSMNKSNEWTIAWASQVGFGLYRVELVRGDDWAYATVGLRWARDAGTNVLVGYAAECDDDEARAWLLSDEDDRADVITSAALRRTA